MLTYRDLRGQALILLDNYSELGTGSQGDLLVANAIAQAHEKRLTKDRWSFMLWPSTQALSFAAATRTYTLHPLVQFMGEFTNTTASQYMKETPTRARFKSRNTMNDRFHYEFVQESPIQLPFAAGKIKVQSGTAILYYVDTSGSVQTETIVAGNFTAQNVDTLLGVTKTDTNPLTLQDSAAKTLLSLAASEQGKSYPQIRLFDDGIAGEVATYRFYRKPKTLVNDYDIPEIPYPFSRVLIYDALLELATYNDNVPAQYWMMQQQEWDMQLRQAYQEGETEGSESRTVIEADNYEG